MIVAFGSVPKDGGTFTFYRNIRPALLQQGIDMRCVSVGRSQAGLWEDAYVDEGCVLLAGNTRSVKKQALAFVNWCKEENVDLVMGVNSEAILSAIPHLPEEIRVLSRCANAFDHGYKITMSGRERLAAIVATTPRLQNDLVADYGADPSLMHLIPNGINPTDFEEAARVPRGSGRLLNIGFLGRLENNQKGVFHLPEIVRELNRREVEFCLRIAGKGQHRSIIEKDMETEIRAGQVEFLGPINPGQVPEFLANTDVFLFTSHFEGCPNALLEALMAGCVPVSWKIAGITDYIIRQGTTGFLSDTGDHRSMAEQVKQLDSDRLKLKGMSSKAASDARDRFCNQRSATSYAELFRTVMNTPPPKWRPRPWYAFKGDANFQHGWREYIPESIKSTHRAIFTK